MRSASLAGLLFWISFPVHAQDEDFELPVVTPPNFSQVVGRYRIESSAAPTEVHVEEPITLKVQIMGKGPAKYRPERKNLRIFPDELLADFHVEDVPDRDRLLPEKGFWEFIYRLRPKRTDVREIPGLQLVYLTVDNKRPQSAFADPVSIKVLPAKESAKFDLKVVRAPDRFYKLRPVEEVVRDDTPLPRPGLEKLALLLALPPALCFVWYRIWRRRHPSAAESRLWRRSRAARAALQTLVKQPADAVQVRAALVDFLRRRVDLAALDPTPAEVAAHLKRLGVRKPLIAAWTTFLQTCDRLRFAPGSTVAPNPLPGEATRLVQELEVDPCVSR